MNLYQLEKLSLCLEIADFKVVDGSSIYFFIYVYKENERSYPQKSKVVVVCCCLIVAIRGSYIEPMCE